MRKVSNYVRLELKPVLWHEATGSINILPWTGYQCIALARVSRRYQVIPWVERKKNAQQTRTRTQKGLSFPPSDLPFYGRVFKKSLE